VRRRQYPPQNAPSAGIGALDARRSEPTYPSSPHRSTGSRRSPARASSCWTRTRFRDSSPRWEKTG